MDLASTTALRLRDALADGTVSAREAAEHYLRRIEELNPRLRSFVTVTADAALEEAGRADQAWAAARNAPGGRANPEPLPPLHGMPVAYKDLWEVAGVPTTFGSAAVPAQTAEADHAVPARLRAAGAVSLGKTQIPEFGLNAYSENRIAPPARNPLDPELTPGGSSGGTAAAVAAGMLPFSPGNDGGGSIRIPAAACGLVGLKPGFGTVPADLVNGTEDQWGAPRLAVSGPIARNAADVALLLDALVGDPGGDDAGAAPGVGRHLAAALRADPGGGRPLRIGLSTRSPFDPYYPTALDADAGEALRRGVVLLERAGHHVEDADLRYDNRYAPAFQTIWTAGLAEAPIPTAGEPYLTRLARDFRDRAARTPAPQKESAARILRKIAEDCRAQWGRYDAVLTPALAHLPPPIGYFTAHGADDDYRLQCLFTPFTSMVNVSGLPAAVLPTHTTAGGLSMGVQLIGRAGSEAFLLGLLAQLEGV
ncbi:amidase [Zafaria sp. Z1313]|uniref:amidase n=1 Tax=unclassified Zafaria TaxID=2828765 RepID=UPI002E79C295|nr:amidase [Zafaria sp. J156]MEE1621423.1 amidase [Zafaria sp. J156]